MRRYTVTTLVALFSVLMIGGVAGCASPDGRGADVVTRESAEEPAGESGAPAAESAGSRENPLPFGATARVGDWEVSIREVITNANDVMVATNEFNDPPSAGSQYVLVIVDAKHVGAESGIFWVDMLCKFYGSGGNTFSPGGRGVALSPNPISDVGEAFTGATITGDILFEVPSDQVEGGAIIMEPLFGDDTQVFFGIE